jgi:hypothetical protein
MEDRRKFHNLTDEQLEQIAARAAEIAIERMTSEVYQAVGKTILHKLAYVVGAAAIGVSVWAASKGWIKP